MKNQQYQFQNFSNYKTIRYGISTKAFGSMKNVVTKEIDRKALATFAQTIDITVPIVCMKQIHSGNVAVVENADLLKISDTDGLITDKKIFALALLIADCLPIFFYDPKNEVIALAHAGYRGLLNHIIDHTVNSLITDFKSDPNDILVGIGPSIETLCYEVGTELIEEFQKEFPSFEDIFIEKDQKFFLDLRGIAEQSLRREGIAKENIEIMDVCTKCDANFYSYRGGDGDKRFASIITLV